MEEKRERVETAVSGVVSGLTKQQREFLVEYLVHGNATRAAEAAGYSNPSQQGSRLRRNAKIQAAIDEFFHAQEMTAREVIARLSEQARAEYAEFLLVDPAGEALRVDLDGLLAAGKGHLVKGINYARTGQDSAVQVVEFYDAFKALVQVGRYHGLFTDRSELSGPEGGPIQFVDVVGPGGEVDDGAV